MFPLNETLSSDLMPTFLKIDGLWENEMTPKQSKREMETEWVKLPYMAMSVVILSILLVTSFSASHRLVYRVRWVLWWLYH